MSNSGVQKAVIFFLISVMLAITFLHLTRDIRDPDFFWHLKTGQWIWQHGEIPLKDPFSFTTEGLQSVRERFIMSSYWLSQAIFWLFFLVAGMPGIVFLRFLIVVSLLLVMMKRKEGDIVLYTGFLLLFLSLLLVSYPIERPQVFSFLLFALLLYLLKGRGAAVDTENRYGRSLFVMLPLLMLTWANMHAGYVAGVAVIALYIGFEGLKFVYPAFRPMERRDFKILVIAGVLGLLISFMNPNTYHIFSENILFPHDYITSGNIEYQSTVRAFMRYHDSSIVVYWLILFITATGTLISYKKIDITETALLLATGYFSFSALRYVPFFLIAALPVLARIYSAGKLKTPARTIILIAALFIGLFFARDRLNFGPLSSGRWIDEQKFPVGAADFILSNDLKGNMYNYFDWGGYLIWRLAPERKIFIDGRTLYSHIYLQSDLIDKADDRRFEGMPAWKAALDEHNIQYTIIPVSLPLVKALWNDKDWVPVYFRYNAAIFVRDRPENREVIEKYDQRTGDLKRDHAPERATKL
ncbi:MAG: hypothetical protein WA610_08125 [Thermodesulfovibrionales bacterium]